MNGIIQKLANKISLHQIKIELVLIALLSIGIILKDTETGIKLVIISLGLLATLYFLMAYRLISPSNRFLTFINKVIYFSFSIGMIGILFTINHYPNAGQMLKIGLISILFGLIGLLILKYRIKPDNRNLNSDLIRTFVIATILSALMAFGNLSDFRQINPDQSIEKIELNEN